MAEAETHWCSFLQSLVDCGMRGIKLVGSDDYAGLKAARQAVLAGVRWQGCQFHLMQNAMAHALKIGMRAEVASDLRRVFDAEEPAEAERRLRDVDARYQSERTPPPYGPRSWWRGSGAVQPLRAMRRRARLTALASARDRRSSWR